MNHFDYLNSINLTKQDVMVDDICEKDYNSFKGCILEHDDFFYNTHHYPIKSFWRWDSEYNLKGSKRCAENTKWFLDNLVEL